MTQKQIIIKHLEAVNDWIPAYELRGLDTQFGFLGHQSDRRCRELFNEGKIERKIARFVYYRRGSKEGAVAQSHLFGSPKPRLPF